MSVRLHGTICAQHSHWLKRPKIYLSQQWCPLVTGNIVTLSSWCLLWSQIQPSQLQQLSNYMPHYRGRFGNIKVCCHRSTWICVYWIMESRILILGSGRSKLIAIVLCWRGTVWSFLSLFKEFLHACCVRYDYVWLEGESVSMQAPSLLGYPRLPKSKISGLCQTFQM